MASFTHMHDAVEVLRKVHAYVTAEANKETWQGGC
jgi:hypothetical protein